MSYRRPLGTNSPHNGAGSSSSGSYGYESHDAFMQQNDEHASDLSAKVNVLREISLQIGDEVNYQNKLLSGMESDFDKTGNILTHTIKRLGQVARSPNGWNFSGARKKKNAFNSIAEMPPRRKKTATVASLHPSPGITVIESARIIQACQLMASKRMDCVLAVNADGQLSGILTDKDIAYRVVAAGLDFRTATVAQVMTRDPMAVFESGPRNDALGVMVSHRFRHLPVISVDEGEGSDSEEETNIVGVLDITKCVFDKLDDLAKKVAAETRRTPNLQNVLTTKPAAPLLSADASVREAAATMRDRHETAVLVTDDQGHLTGILTTKDIVSRVVAAGLDPNETDIDDIMTKNPKSAPPSTTILDALKMLYAGHYLHLPVCDGHTPIGLVDVLTLTMSILDYMLQTDPTSTTLNPTTSAETSGPAWNQFWNSTWSTADSESNAGSEAFSDESHPSSQHPNRASTQQTYYTAQTSGLQSTRTSYLPPPPGSSQQRQSIPAQIRSPIAAPGIDIQNNTRLSLATHRIGSPDASSMSGSFQQQRGYLPPSMQHHQGYPPRDGTVSPTATSVYDDPTRYGVKLTDTQRGRVVRFNTGTGTTLEELKSMAETRLGATQEGMRLSYEDDDGDWVLLSSDADLEDAVAMVRRLGEKLNLRCGEVAPVLNGQVVQRVDAEIVASEGREVGKKEDGGVVDFLKDAPLSVNVAISAGIVVVAVFVVSRLVNPRGY
ncbi:hypothetical protein HDU98_007986 [Podochytrium sp. JEL0797]|nr:hypothetical protein HDU98_007986 [Podochytrium sp. JEL0797]